MSRVPPLRSSTASTTATRSWESRRTAVKTERMSGSSPRQRGNRRCFRRVLSAHAYLAGVGDCPVFRAPCRMTAVRERCRHDGLNSRYRCALRFGRRCGKRPHGDAGVVARLSRFAGNGLSHFALARNGLHSAAFQREQVADLLTQRVIQRLDNQRSRGASEDGTQNRGKTMTYDCKYPHRLIRVSDSGTERADRRSVKGVGLRQ
jgi:hypothetical protein